MHLALKLLTGIAATIVLTRGATLHQGQAIMGELGNAAASAMQAHGIMDGSVEFRQPSNRVARIARISGTADAATQAAILAQVKRHPGIADAVWVAR